jgi:hypothetical protein
MQLSAQVVDGRVGHEGGTIVFGGLGQGWDRSRSFDVVSDCLAASGEKQAKKRLPG